MTLKRIMALRDLDYEQLWNLAGQRGIVKRLPETREWSPDRLRLRLIDDICDEELREQRKTDSQLRREAEIDAALGQGRR